MAGSERAAWATQRPRLAVSALVALALTGVPAPSFAAGAATYVVRAERSGWVDVDFRTAVTLDTGKSRVTGSGWYAGYYVQPLNAAPDGGYGEMWLSDFTYPSFARFPLPLGNGQTVLTYQRAGSMRRLSPGRYRLHVLGDGPVTARLALTGVRGDKTVTASRRSTLSAVRKDVTPAVAGQRAPGAAVAELPVTVTSPRSLTFVATFAAYHATNHTATGAINQCIGSPGQQLPCDGGDSAYGYSHNERHVQNLTTVTDAVTGAAVYYPVGVLPTGQRAGHFSVATPAVIGKIVVAAFSLAY